MLLRAARSITRTKSVSGSFIVKTKISKSTEKSTKQQILSSSIINESPLAGIQEGRGSQLRASYQNVPAGHLSPKYSDSLQQNKTPNPLIKYSYISPDQSYKEESAYANCSIIPAFSTLSNKRSAKTNDKSGQRGISVNSGKAALHKIDIS